tara:strand:+ start:604 stop:777 length:174 start_codon:yes stop_codon:yes gene_type:complete
MEPTKVKVGNIHRDATSALLHSFFEFHGHILRTQYATPKPRATPPMYSSSKRARTWA